MSELKHIKAQSKWSCFKNIIISLASAEECACLELVPLLLISADDDMLENDKGIFFYKNIGHRVPRDRLKWITRKCEKIDLSTEHLAKSMLGINNFTKNIYNEFYSFKENHKVFSDMNLI